MSSLTAKEQAEAAVMQQEWSRARELYMDALKEADDEAEQQSKIHANLSMVCLKQYASQPRNDNHDHLMLQEALQHAHDAIALTETWGKAHARLGQVQQVAGHLLEAHESFANAIQHDFSPAQSLQNKLSRSKRYKKLALIRQAMEQQGDLSRPWEMHNSRGQVIQDLLPETDDPHCAYAVMNTGQRAILEMIRNGRVLPEGATKEELIEEQDLILYLQAVDASILLHARTHPYSDALICPGTRAWIITNGKIDFQQEQGRKVLGDPIVDIYHELLHSSQNGEYQKCWRSLTLSNDESYLAYTLLFCPNRHCDKEAHWGPTVYLEARRFYPGDLQRDSEVVTSATFLIGLNHWLCVQNQTDALPITGTGTLPNGEYYLGAFQWDREQQKLVDNNRQHHRPDNFYHTARIAMQWFPQWDRPEKVPYDWFFSVDT